MPWIVLRTKPHRERWAAENVDRQDFPHYLPCTLETLKAPLRLKVTRPLFPGFLFVRIESRWYCLLSTFGVIGAVMRGEQPDVMPDPAIYQLQMRENRDGYIDLPPAPKRVRVNKEARVERGVLAGRTGLVTGMSDKDRIKVMFDVLGRKTEILVAERDLVAA